MKTRPLSSKMICDICGGTHAYHFQGQMRCDKCLIEGRKPQKWTGGELPQLSEQDLIELRECARQILEHVQKGVEVVM